ncbi:MAG TPA: DUF3341 domain-containing protein [Phycisphaeraceae bacterium]
MTQVDSPQVATPRRPQAAQEEELYGLLAEFEDVPAVKSAAHALKRAGYRYFEVYSPFPIHGLDHDLDIQPTILPWLVLGGGLAGCVGGLALTIWTMAVDYPYLISGKPFNSLPAWIPIVFECTVLCSALTAVFGMLLLNQLPLLAHPLLKVSRFRRVTDDRFFIGVLKRDKLFDAERTAAFLRKQGASAVELVSL